MLERDCTGGAKGICKAIAVRLLESGAKVHIWNHNRADVSGAKANVVDVTRADQID